MPEAPIGKITTLNEIKDEIKRLRTLLNSNHPFTASKRLISEAINLVKKEDFEKAKENLKKAQELAELEISIFNDLSTLRERIKIEGRSSSLAKIIENKIRNGELDEARNLIKDLREFVKTENVILDKIKEVEELISQNLPGSNPKEAERLKNEAKEELLKGNYEKAEELIESAKITAKPTPAYLLQKARKLALQAEQHFDSEEFEKAIELWNASIEEYERAKESAKERKDLELVKEIESVQEKIRRNIESAEIALDNRTMLNIVSQANEFVEQGNKLSTSNYDEALNSYRKAIDLFNSALTIAEKRGFKEDAEKIKRGIESVNRSIEGVLLKKGKYLINKAVGNEKELYSVLDYLKSIKNDVKDVETLNALILECSEHIITAKLKKVEEIMNEAEELFNSANYYDAREKYREAWEMLNEIEDEAISLKATSKLNYIRNLRDACDENITIARQALLQIGEKKPKLISVNEVKEGKVEIEAKPRKIIHFEFPKELKEELEDYTNFEYYDEGGQAYVFKAKRKSDGLEVAIKIPKVVDKKTAKDFIDEISLWKDLHHKNIAKIYDYSAHPRPFLIMEFCPTNLANVEKPMPKFEAAKLLYKIASAMLYAHKKGRIHTDLKPSNILLSNDFEPKIADWGLGKVLSSSKKSEGKARGYTLLYASPEQVNDEKVDEKTDVWQLGVIFYELLTGKNPFSGENESTIIENILNREIKPPSHHNPNLKDLDSIVMGCLEREKEKRMSMEELVSKLASYIGEEYDRRSKITKSRLDRIDLCADIIKLFAERKDAENTLKYLIRLKELVKSDVKEKIDREIMYLRECVLEGVEMSDLRVKKILNIIEEARRKG